MAVELPEVVTVLVITRTNQAFIDRINAVAPGRVEAHAVWDDFQPELAEEWPAETMKRRGGGDGPPKRSREELEELIQKANAAIVGVPWPIGAPGRMKKLAWAHLPFAGVTNLSGTPWWDRRLIVTSARGSTNAIPIAESAMAGAFMLARRLDIAVRQTDARQLDASAYSTGMSVLKGKTLGVIGLGGIGGEVARIARGVGMRVIATRHSAKERSFDVDGVDVLMPPSETHDLMAESDYIALCAMWTPETDRRHAMKKPSLPRSPAPFSSMSPGARIVDEPAMVEALEKGQLGGAYIDVWRDDTSSPPPIAELRHRPQPHHHAARLARLRW